MARADKKCNMRQPVQKKPPALSVKRLTSSNKKGRLRGLLSFSED